ncbi:MAG: crossover junction endodeoxyribonuclease RuvC [Candidatus Spechtbacterales bacterium]|nr:crossover junction endodeoxyribonuclease RuvC [Candidatus Spechtbacterales bacterium]
MQEKISRIIFGIDPGTARMGYGVLKYEKPSIECLDYGVIETSAGNEKHKRLESIYEQLNTLIEKYSPDAFGVEDIFYFKNQKTLVEVSQARGVALLVAAQTKKPCHSFTPLQVKQAVAGYGRADKKQVQIMTQKLLNLKKIPRPDDAADALAVALCCASSLDVLEAYKS